MSEDQESKRITVMVVATIMNSGWQEICERVEFGLTGEPEDFKPADVAEYIAGRYLSALGNWRYAFGDSDLGNCTQAVVEIHSPKKLSGIYLVDICVSVAGSNAQKIRRPKPSDFTK